MRKAMRPVLRIAAFAASAGLLSSCAVAARLTGATSAPPTSVATSPLAHRLLALTAHVASLDGGSPALTEAVRTTSARAQRYVFGNAVASSTAVWVVQAEGSFACTACAQPGSSAPRGRVLTLIVDAANLSVTDVGVGDRVVDLGTLGHVLLLRR